MKHVYLVTIHDPEEDEPRPADPMDIREGIEEWISADALGIDVDVERINTTFKQGEAKESEVRFMTYLVEEVA